MEMVIAVSMMAIVLAAVLPLFAGIRNSWDTKQAGTEIIQNARVLVDHLRRNLAPAVAVTEVSASSQEDGHIEFTSNDGVSRRYAVSGDGYVQFGPLGESAELAGPVSRFRFTCYDGNDFATPITDPPSIRFVTVEMAFPNPAPLGQEKIFATSVYLRSETGTSTSLVEPGVAVRDTMAWGGFGTVIDSYRSSQGFYDPGDPGSEAVVSVNATGYGMITLWGATRIRGDAYIGPGGDPDLGIITSGGSEITGTRGTLPGAVSMARASAPSYPPFNRGHEGKLSLGGSTSELIESDRYFNKIQLWDSSKLVVDGHVTVLVKTTFVLGHQAEVDVLPDSSLTLYVKGNLEVGDSAKLNDSTKDPSRLHIYMIGNNKAFEMGNDAIVHGVVENPDGRVSIGNSAELFGKAQAAQLLGGGRIHVDLDCSFDSGND